MAGASRGKNDEEQDSKPSSPDAHVIAEESDRRLDRKQNITISNVDRPSEKQHKCARRAKTLLDNDEFYGCEGGSRITRDTAGKSKLWQNERRGNGGSGFSGCRKKSNQSIVAPSSVVHAEDTMLASKETAKFEARRPIYDEPYSRENCEERFAAASQLKKHSLMHAVEKQYTCEDCETEFSDYGKFLCHMFAHVQDEQLQQNCKNLQKSTADR